MAHAITTGTNYDLFVNILADLVTKCLPSHPVVLRAVAHEIWEELQAIMEQEDMEWMDFEMTAELLGTRDFVRLI